VGAGEENTAGDAGRANYPLSTMLSKDVRNKSRASRFFVVWAIGERKTEKRF
jgi:hypothetical protein